MNSSESFTISQPISLKRSTAVLVGFLLVLVAAGAWLGGTVRLATTYLFLVSPIVLPPLRRVAIAGRAPSRSPATLVERGLSWRRRFWSTRLDRARLDGAATIAADGADAVLSLHKGPTLVVSGAGAGQSVLGALDLTPPVTGTLRFPVKQSVGAGTVVIRLLPVVVAAAVDWVFFSPGASIYLFLLPPFHVAIFMAFAQMVDLNLELRKDGLFLLASRVAEYSTIERVERDDASILVRWTTTDGEKTRLFELAAGHEWLAGALCECLDRAATRGRAANAA